MLRGVRQGCSFTGILYSLAIEPFLQRLRSVMKGVSLPNCNNTFYLSAYADDVILMVMGQDDVDTLRFLRLLKLSLLPKWSSLNWSKSDAFSVGKWNKGYQVGEHEKMMALSIWVFTLETVVMCQKIGRRLLIK